MTSNVQTNSTPKPMDYSDPKIDVKRLDKGEEVGQGDLNKENLKISNQYGQKEYLKGQELRAPKIETPKDVKPTHVDSANMEVKDINQLTEKSMKEALAFKKNIEDGKLTETQKDKLKNMNDVLKKASNYLRNLQGNNINGLEGKKSILAGLGFNESQMEALLSLADPDDDGNFLASLHGGVPALKKKVSHLVKAGFTQDQAESILSSLPKDVEGKSLNALRELNSDNPKLVLKALGLNSKVIENLLNTFGKNEKEVNAPLHKSDKESNIPSNKNGPNNLPRKNDKELSPFQTRLMNLGFTKEQAMIISVMPDPKKVMQQNALASGENNQPKADALQVFQTRVSNFLSGQSIEKDGFMESLVDMFSVMEILHNMSVQSRRTAREMRSAEYDAAKQKVMNQASEIRSAAVATAAAGFVTSGMKIVAGATTIKGATNAAKMKTESQRNLANTRLTAKTNILNAAADLMAVAPTYMASEHQARQKEQEAFQKTDENAAQSSSEWMQLQQDMVKTVQSKMDEIIRTVYETLKTSTRG